MIRTPVPNLNTFGDKKSLMGGRTCPHYILHGRKLCEERTQRRQSTATSMQCGGTMEIRIFATYRVLARLHGVLNIGNGVRF
jgi:hypothetical protein